MCAPVPGKVSKKGRKKHKQKFTDDAELIERLDKDLQSTGILPENPKDVMQLDGAGGEGEAKGDGKSCTTKINKPGKVDAALLELLDDMNVKTAPQ